MSQALMSAHVPTMMLMLLIVSGLTTLAVLFVGKGQGGSTGLPWWGGALLLNTVADVFFVMAADDAAPWLLVGGYWCQSVGYAAALQAVLASFSWHVNRTWFWLPTLLVIVLSVAFAHDALQLVKLVELIIAVQLAFLGWTAWRGDHPERQKRTERGRLLLVVGVIFGALSYFQRVVQAWIDPHAALDLVSPDAWQTLSYTQGIAALLFATLGLVLMHMERAEAAALRANEALVEVERERARLDERRRLLQDVHDGFGSQLATARLRVLDDDLDRQQLSDVLRECLDDLHLVIDTLNSPDNSLENALIDYRHRMSQRLARMPIDIEWQIELDACPPLHERVILQVLRILQEALANALKHAQAKRIVVATRCCAGEAALQVVVADDGAGMPIDIVRGRGLDNMRARARAIGARLRWERNDPGTRVVLEVPFGDGIRVAGKPDIV
jgi:signal transduction histidine kinase